MANDIPLGSVTKDEVLSATNQAWLIEGTIDDNAYDEIRKLIEREHKSYQSTAIKEGVNYGQGQLVTVTQGVVDILIAKQLTGEEVDIETAIEKRELELWNMGQYRKALNDWLTAHPEAESDEIYIESRKLITQYRRPLTEIKTARDDFEQRLTSGEKIPPARIKARFENSIRVADPSGRTGWSEEGIFETELKPRGFTRVGADAEGSKNKTE